MPLGFARLEQMNAVPASVQWEWDFSFARMDSCVEVGYLPAREAEVKHRRYSVLERVCRRVPLLKFVV